MKSIFFVFVILSICSCTSTTTTGLELEILTQKINCVKINRNDYLKHIKNDTVAIKDSRTIVRYKLTNNTNKTYYFNLGNDPEVESQYIKIDRANLGIIDSRGNYMHVRARDPSREFVKKWVYLDYLNYNYDHNFPNSNFIIHAHEVLYFEWFVVLPFGNLLEDTNYSVVLNNNKKYFVELMIKSDTTRYKKNISRTDLKTIKENGYEIFNGIIKSKNKVPIFFHDLPLQ